MIGSRHGHAVCIGMTGQSHMYWMATWLCSSKTKYSLKLRAESDLYSYIVELRVSGGALLAGAGTGTLGEQPVLACSCKV